MFLKFKQLIWYTVKSEYFIILFIYSSFILIKHSAVARMSRLLQKYIWFCNLMIPFHYQLKYHLKIEIWIYESSVRSHCQMRCLPLHGMSNRSSWKWQWRKPGPSLFFQGKAIGNSKKITIFSVRHEPMRFYSVTNQSKPYCGCCRQRCNKLIGLYANTLKQVLQENSLIDCIER